MCEYLHFRRVLQDRGLMGNIGHDPSEYLPPDYRHNPQQPSPGNQQPQPQYGSHDLDNPAFDLRNQYAPAGAYDNGDGSDSRSDVMNGPTGVDMYERRSPNAFVINQHVHVRTL